MQKRPKRKEKAKGKRRGKGYGKHHMSHAFSDGIDDPIGHCYHWIGIGHHGYSCRRGSQGLKKESTKMISGGPTLQTGEEQKVKEDKKR